MKTIHKLRPVSFTWTASSKEDLGFIAEEVAMVNSLLATYDANGEIEGVKYKQITAVLVNAINEQQAQIEGQREQISNLMTIVCADHPDAAVCL